MALYRDSSGREEWLVVASFVLARPRPDLRTMLLRPDHFADGRCRQALDRARQLSEKRTEDWQPWDVLEPKVLEELSGADAAMGASGDHLLECQRRILDRWRVRQLRHDLDVIMKRLHAETEPKPIVEALQQLVVKIQAGGIPDIEAYRTAATGMMGEWFDLVREARDAACNKDVRGPIIPLALHELAKRYGGLQLGKTYEIAACTSVHKTTLARMMWSHGGDTGYPGLFWTLEDKSADVITRDLAAHERAITTRTFQHFYPEEGELSAILNATERRLSEPGTADLFVYDEALPTLDRVCEVLACAAAQGVKLVVLDFLQLIRKSDKRTDDLEHVFLCANTLAGLAKQLNFVLVLTVQPTHAATKAHEEYGKPITMGDLRGGAPIAQAAWAVILLNRPFDPESKRPRRDVIDLTVAKWKQAKPTRMRLAVDPASDLILDVRCS